MGLAAFDAYSKTRDELQERTLGGAVISVVCSICALLLFVSEFNHYRAYETTDRLGVDTTTPATSKLPVNIDMYLPSLPCSEIILEVIDEAGTQQIAVTDSLQKLRVDREGVPIDLPQQVDWEHAVAPGFQQRKLVQVMEEAHEHLGETLLHLKHEDEENPALSPEEHEQHRLQLAQQARLPPCHAGKDPITPMLARPIFSVAARPAWPRRRRCFRGGWSRWQKLPRCRKTRSTARRRRRSCTSS